MTEAVLLADEAELRRDAECEPPAIGAAALAAERRFRSPAAS
jgi:hypothetical protein